MSEFAAAASSVPVPPSTATADPVFPAAELAAMRARFSSLTGDFVYLDAPGGTQTPDEIGAAVAKVYLEASGNTGAPYATSRRLDMLVDEARAASARFFGCAPEEIIFGGNMTSLNFMLTRTLGRELKPGDEIVVTRLDHDGNVAPWLDLASDLGLVVRHADVHADTTLDLADLERQLGPRTRVVAFPWCANSTGTIVDARAVCDLARAAGALSWVDAVQYAAHEPMDVQAIGADLVACSAYKFCGPHLGIAYGRRELLESWRPVQGPAGADGCRRAPVRDRDAALRAARRRCWRPTPTSTASAAWPGSRRGSTSSASGCWPGCPTAPGSGACRPWTAGCRCSWSTSPASRRRC